VPCRAHQIKRPQPRCSLFLNSCEAYAVNLSNWSGLVMVMLAPLIMIH
jgi:hypothetical protein